MVGNNVGIRKAVTINAVIAAVVRKTIKAIFSGRKVNTNPEHARFAGINLIGYPINQAHRNCNCIRYFEILPIGNRYKGIIVKNVVANDGITVAVCIYAIIAAVVWISIKAVLASWNIRADLIHSLFVGN